MLKDRELQTYYEEVLAMFKSPGWQFLAEDMQKLVDTYDRLSSVTATESLDFRRGQLDILYWLLRRPDAMEYAYKLLVERENA